MADEMDALGRIDEEERERELLEAEKHLDEIETLMANQLATGIDACLEVEATTNAEALTLEEQLREQEAKVAFKEGEAGEMKANEEEGEDDAAYEEGEEEEDEAFEEDAEMTEADIKEEGNEDEDDDGDDEPAEAPPSPPPPGVPEEVEATDEPAEASLPPTAGVPEEAEATDPAETPLPTDESAESAVGASKEEDEEGSGSEEENDFEDDPVVDHHGGHPDVFEPPIPDAETNVAFAKFVDVASAAKVMEVVHEDCAKLVSEHGADLAAELDNRDERILEMECSLFDADDPNSDIAVPRL